MSADGEAGYGEIVEKGEQELQAVLRKSIETESSSSQTKQRRPYGLTMKIENILKAVQSLLADFTVNPSSVSEEHCDAAIKCLQLCVSIINNGLVSFHLAKSYEFFAEHQTLVTEGLYSFDQAQTTRFGLKFWSAHVQLVLAIPKHLTPEVVKRVLQPASVWVKAFDVDTAAQVYTAAVKLADEIKKSNLRDDLKSAAITALEVSDMVPLSVAAKWPSPSKILVPTNFAGLFKSPNKVSNSVVTSSGRNNRRSVKRQASLDEDSVDYVPIISTNSAKKKAKLTDRQKEKFAEKKDRLAFMDEDSQSNSQQQRLIGVLAKDFDIESSEHSQSNQTQSQRAASQDKKMKISVVKKLEAKRGLKEEKENPGDETKEVERKTPTPDENRRKTNVKLDFEQSSMKLVGEPNLKAGKDDSEENVARETIEAIVDELVPATPEDKIDDKGSLPTLEERMVETPLKAPLTPEKQKQSDNSPAKQAEKSPTKSPSVASQATPDKSDRFSTPEKRASPMVESPSSLGHNASKRKSRTPIKHQARPRWTIMDSIAKVKQDKKRIIHSTTVTADTNTFTLPPISLNESSTEAATPTEILLPPPTQADTKDFVRPQKLTIGIEEEDERMQVDQLEEDDKQVTEQSETKTPPRISIEAAKSSSTNTPSILKKAGTPGNSEKKKYRVHFHSPEKAAVATNDESADASQNRSTSSSSSTSTDGWSLSSENQPSIAKAPESERHKEKEAEDDSPICPLLVDCSHPVTNVIPRLIPHGHSSTSIVMLRKALEAQGVKTVGELSRMRPGQIMKLNFKKPRIETTRNVLTEYHDKEEREKKLAVERMQEAERRRKEEEEAEAAAAKREQQEEKEKNEEAEKMEGVEEVQAEEQQQMVEEKNDAVPKESTEEHTVVEDDEELQVSLELGLPNSLPLVWSASQGNQSPMEAKMKEENDRVQSQENQENRDVRQELEQEEIVILDFDDSDKENVSARDSSQSADGAGDDIGSESFGDGKSRNPKRTSSIHTTPQSGINTTNREFPVSPKFSPIKRPIGILTELVTHRAEDIEEFVLPEETLPVEPSNVCEKQLTGEEEEDKENEYEPIMAEESEEAQNIEKFIEVLRSLPSDCATIVSRSESLPIDQLRRLKEVLVSAILPFNSLVAELAYLK